MSNMLDRSKTEFARMLALSDDQFKAELATYGDDQAGIDRRLAVVEAGVWQSVRSLQLAAMAWKDAKRVASDLGTELEMKAGSRRDFLNRIAEGRVDAEALWELGASDARESLAARVLSMPVDVQRKLVVEKERVPVAERAPDGTITHRELTVTEIPPAAYGLVFGRYGPRPLGEQKARLAHTAPVVSRTETPDLAVMVGELRKAADSVLVASGKREQRRAAEKVRELAEKIDLLVR